MSSVARKVFPSIACLVVLALSGCSSVSKVNDWFAKSDSPTPDPMTANSATAVLQKSPVVYNSQSGPAVPQQPATAGAVTSYQPNQPAQPVFPSTLPQQTYAPPVVTTSAPSAQPGLARGGNPAPTVTAKTMDGGSFDLSQQIGKVTLLDFWKTTCGPCLRAIPTVKTLRGQYGPHQLTVIGINCDERLRTASSYVKSNPHPWPQVHAYSQSPNPIRSYGVSTLPVFVVIDQIGNIQYKGNNITTAVAKVAELAQTPSIPQNATAGFYTAQR
jgi:thiol-disulfide isomerase/thioredoxin